MLKCFHGWIPSTISTKLFKPTLKKFYNSAEFEKDLTMNYLPKKGLEKLLHHFFAEGFSAARDIAELEQNEKNK